MSVRYYTLDDYLSDEKQRAERLMMRAVMGFTAPRLIAQVLKASHERTCDHAAYGLA